MKPLVYKKAKRVRHQAPVRQRFAITKGDTVQVVSGEDKGKRGRVLRVHPKTGRTMIYLACTPTHGTSVFVGDEEELAEVRWLSLAEADELLPGMFEPVREHLGRVIS